MHVFGPHGGLFFTTAIYSDSIHWSVAMYRHEPINLAYRYVRVKENHLLGVQKGRTPPDRVAGLVGAWALTPWSVARDSPLRPELIEAIFYLSLALPGDAAVFEMARDGVVVGVRMI